MLQEATAAAPAAAGGNNAAALQQMGFDHLIQNFDVVGWAVFITLSVMSVMSWYWIIINFIKNMRLRGRGDKVIGTFWETPNAQDAIRYMEEQPASEPFSKIALDAAQAIRADARRLQHPMLRREIRRGKREVGGAGRIDGLQRGLVGGKQVEPRHQHFEQRIALGLLGRGLRGGLDDGIVHGPQDPPQDVRFAFAKIPHAREIETRGFGDLRERHVLPRLRCGEVEGGLYQAARGCVKVEHARLLLRR